VLSWYNDLSFWKMACTEQAPWGTPLWHALAEGPDAKGPLAIKRQHHWVLPIAVERPGCRTHKEWEQMAQLREMVLVERSLQKQGPKRGSPVVRSSSGQALAIRTGHGLVRILSQPASEVWDPAAEKRAQGAAGLPGRAWKRRGGAARVKDEPRPRH
jgi:hypothetical protein